MQVTYEKEDILRMIDSTELNADATREDIEKLCRDAHKYGFSAVMINPVYVPLAVRVLTKLRSSVKVGTVVGFPSGSETTRIKILQAKQAVKAGAHDIDAVMPVYAVKQGKWNVLEDEVRRLTKICKGRTLKIILEVCYLTDDEIVKACEICAKHRVRFVKTSTGLGRAKREGTNGATKNVVELMRASVEKTLYGRMDRDQYPTEIKAAGGITDYMQAKMFAEAGARRLGTSSAVRIAESTIFDASEMDVAIEADIQRRDAEAGYSEHLQSGENQSVAADVQAADEY
ncbi:MAG: deoxyribose-phosphate aldolase [Firmicutes bacterium]|nr:deoxyribose-phosphate aldolase [Bacillota bacterium]